MARSGPSYPNRFWAAAAYAGFGSQASSSSLRPRFSDEASFILYALYQQATVGPCKARKPQSWNTLDGERWKSWHALGDMVSVEAMRLFVKILEEEDPAWLSKVQEPEPETKESSSDKEPRGKDWEAAERLAYKLQSSLSPYDFENYKSYLYTMARCYNSQIKLIDNTGRAASRKFEDVVDYNWNEDQLERRWNMANAEYRSGIKDYSATCQGDPEEFDHVYDERIYNGLQEEITLGQVPSPIYD
ncbi:hypothetical protein L7F22_015238 [Adiantum nelumboides]|nr:hypothetical protein [Adiantum nelumboides]